MSTSAPMTWPPTVAFYRDVLALESVMSPFGLPEDRALWLVDGGGQAILHLYRGPAEPIAGPGGAIHHVPLRCTGLIALLEQLRALSIKHRINRPSARMTQVFVHDPNGVLLELSFDEPAADAEETR